MKHQAMVEDRLVDRMEEIRDCLCTTENDAIAAHVIMNHIIEIEGQVIIEDMEDRLYMPTGDVVYGG